jgi:hypothetical protein
MYGNKADLEAIPAGAQDDFDALIGAQDQAVADLNSLNLEGPWTVDAGPVPTYSQQACWADWSHGRGVVYFPGFDGGCVRCAKAWARENLVEGMYLSMDVTR